MSLKGVLETVERWGVAEWTAILAALASWFLVVFAWRAWTVGKRTLEAARRANEAAAQANHQARHDSIQSTRPYVFVEFLPGLAGVGCWDIRIFNAGRSAARSLTLTYSEWPSELDMISAALQTLFDTPRTLPPGCSIRAYWRIDEGKDQRLDGLGHEGVIGVRYTSDDPSHPVYSDKFEVTIFTSGEWPRAEEGFVWAEGQSVPRQFYKLGQALIRVVGELRR